MAAALKKDHEAEGREMVCLLLAAGANATAQDTQHGRTTLHTATMANDVELVKIILDAEVDVNLRNVHNIIPLHAALAYLIVYNIHWHALLFGLLCCGDMFT